MNEKRLEELYNNTSKHSNYQVLASSLHSLLPTADLNVKSRWEQERFEFMCQHFSFDGSVVGDIGGNTGFFSFEMIEKGAATVHYYEGNSHHANFVREAANQLGLAERLNVNPGYFEFDDLPQAEFPEFDSVLLLNVLHHVGDDYGDQELPVSDALAKIADSLRKMVNISKSLIFQLGFNWKGDRNQPLFKHGTKNELIEFINDSSKGVWNIDQTGIPEKRGEEIVYAEKSVANLERDDSLGEFLNRPLFILTRN